MVEMAGTLVCIFTVFLLVFTLIRAAVAKDVLNYVAVQASQCMKYGNKDANMCVRSALNGLGMFLDEQKITPSVRYYDSLEDYQKTTGSHKAKSIAMLTLSYKFMTDSAMLDDLFPETMTFSSAAVVRIEK